MTDLFVVLNGPHVQKDSITGQLEFYENERAAYSALSHCEDGCKVMKVECAFILKPHTTTVSEGLKPSHDWSKPDE
jgi:hypothetical protein